MPTMRNRASLVLLATAALSLSVGGFTLAAEDSGGLGEQRHESQIQNNWEEFGPGGGGTLYGVWPDPTVSTRVYVGGAVIGVHVTNDSGETWEYLTDGWRIRQVQDLFFDPNDSTHLFVSAIDGIYESADSGQTWARYGNPAQEGDGVYFSDIDGAYNANGDLVLYVGSGRSDNDSNGLGVLYKRVGTGLWTTIPLPMSDPTNAVHSVLLNENNLNALYVSTGSGIFSSHDSGNTWTDISTAAHGLPSKDARKLIHQPANFSRLAVVLASGRVFTKDGPVDDWVDRTGDLPSISRLNSIIQAPGPWGTSFYIGSASGQDGVYFTANADAAAPHWELKSGWENVPNRGWAGSNRISTNTYSLAREPGPDGGIWAGRSGHIYRTTDGGDTWIQKYTTRVGQCPAQDPNPNGVSWRGGCWAGRGYHNAWPRRVAVSPANPDKMFVNYIDRVIFRSRDGGASWQRGVIQFNGQATHDSFMTVFDPNNSNVVYTSAAKAFGAAQGEGALFKSTDAGATFQLEAGTNAEINGLGSGEIWDLVFTPNHNRYAVIRDEIDETGQITQEFGVYESLNGTNTWTNIGLGGERIHDLAVHPSNNQILYAAGESGIWKGEKSAGSWSWTNVQAGESRKVVVDPTSPNRLYAGFFGGGGVKKSTDGGATWQTVLDTPGFVSGGLTIDPATGNVFASHDGTFSDRPAVMMSTDHGTTWTNISGNLNMPMAEWLEIYQDGATTYLLAAQRGRTIARLALN